MPRREAIIEPNFPHAGTFSLLDNHHGVRSKPKALRIKKMAATHAELLDWAWANNYLVVEYDTPSQGEVEG